MFLLFEKALGRFLFFKDIYFFPIYAKNLVITLRLIPNTWEFVERYLKGDNNEVIEASKEKWRVRTKNLIGIYIFRTILGLFG